MKKYSSFDDLKKDCPGISESIEMENEGQFPYAKFLAAVSGQYGVGVDPNNEDLIALFDVGIPEEVLFVLGCGYLADSVPDSRTYIDEYYVMPELEARQYMEKVK
jgi:hypothetical protein